MKQNSSKKTSIHDVAREAGVSITTVSRVINKSGLVSPDTKERVLEAVSKLRYKPDISAKFLASKQSSNLIGIVVPYFTGIFGSFYFSEILTGINDLCMAQEIDTLFHFSKNITKGELSTRLVFNPSFVKGLIFIDLDGDENKINCIKKEELPLVVVNHYVENISVDCIGVDNLSAASEAVNYLINLGHRKIATVCGNLETQAGLARLEGYNKALEDNGFEVRDQYVVGNSFLPEDARKAMLQLLNLPEIPTAVFLASDDMAVEAMNVAFEKGYKVPEDISIIGFDDAPSALRAQVPLTTIKQPLREMGNMAAELIPDIANNEDRQKTTKVLLPTKLIKRQSCCKLL